MTESVRIESLDGWLGQRFRTAWEGNLRQLDWEGDFLQPFRAKSAAGGYVGLGKTLAGLLHAARHFGGAAEALRRRIVDELLKTQETEGYIGLYEPAARTHKVWDVHEQAYIMQALVENAEGFGEPASRQAAERLGRWLLPRLANGRWRAIGKGLWNPLAIIGLDRALLALSRVTGDPVFADFCRDDLQVPQWCDPIVEGRQGGVCGHAYAYLARCLAQLEMTGGEALPEATRAVIGYLRAGGGLVVSGACGLSECWHSDQQLDGQLGETCTSAYLARWAAHLARRTHEAWFGDLLERTIYNALFAANSADGRRIRYYSAGEGLRTWHRGDTYCCPGNYRRIIGELPGFIARPHKGGLAIDLYEACRLATTIGDAAVRLRMTTDYPFDPTVTITVEPERSTTFPLYLRQPGWAAGVTLRCNGEACPAASRQGWITVEREWRPGDRLELAFGMPWRLMRGFRRQLGRVALMRGPVVWGAEPADNKLPAARLSQFVPLPESGRLAAEPHRAMVSGEWDGDRADLQLRPFAELDTAVTYFAGRPGLGDERDPLLWLAPDVLGADAAPET